MESSTFSQRDERTIWYNEKPITDLYEALYFLNIRGSSSDPYHLKWNVRKSVEVEWELVAPWARDGCSGGATSGDSYYQIDQALAAKLIQEEYVVNHEEKYFSGSVVIHDEFVISRKGKEELDAFESKMAEKARTFIVVGTHTDLTGEVRSAGQGRTERYCGRLHFDFCGPDSQRVRVFPELGEVVMLPD